MDPIASAKAHLVAQDASFRKNEQAPAPARSLNGSELRPENTVAPVQPAEKARPKTPQHLQQLAFKQSHNAAAQAPDGDPVSGRPPVLRNIEFDAATGTVLFQTVSSQTGEVLSQVPTQAQMRVREYVRTLQPEAEKPQDSGPGNRIA